MKKLFLSIFCLLGMSLSAQQPVITFDRTEHDFGQINEGDGRVSTIFEFKNDGMESLVLSNVRASCGCTTPTWTKSPVEPGERGSITVTYNPNGRPGKFQKTITVTSNATNPTTKVYIKGEVIPKSVKPVDKYPVKIDELSLKTRSVDFGKVKKGTTLSRSIEYANQTDSEIVVNIRYDQDGYIIPALSFQSLKPGEGGTLNLSLVASNTNEYGPVRRVFYMVVNGKDIQDEAHAIYLDADLEEDFSLLSDQALQKAPIIELSSDELNLGEVKSGGKVSGKLSVKNANVSPLVIRRIVNQNDMIAAKMKKSSIKGGKSSDLLIDVTAVSDKGELLKAGVYRRQLELISNDPKQSRKRVTVTWTVVE